MIEDIRAPRDHLGRRRWIAALRNALSARLRVPEADARLAGEIDAARRIQMGMLPTTESISKISKDLDVFARFRSAREMGGDLYDFFAGPGGNFVVAAGDVSGKGLPAAMFMVVAKALAKSCALRSGGDAAATMTMLDKEISRENPEQLFVTFLVLMLDLKSGKLTYCNAGHETPFIARYSGELLKLDAAAGPPLCTVDDFLYEQQDVQLQRGDVLVIVSDGITEAMNAGGSLYGRARLQALIASAMRDDLALSELGNAILDDVTEFEGAHEATDDKTLLLVSWQHR